MFLLIIFLFSSSSLNEHCVLAMSIFDLPQNDNFPSSSTVVKPFLPHTLFYSNSALDQFTWYQINFIL